ncbi:MAG: radical SAM protein [Myxococcota bacterium]
MPGLLDIIMGYDCNVFCDYCTISPDMRLRALSPKAIASELRRGIPDSYDRVQFTGGEPTIRSDLLPLVRFAAAAGYRDIKVQSNGLLLAAEPNRRRLFEAGVTRVHQSIHTHRADMYDALVRREGTYPQMVAALEALAVAPIEFGVDLIMKEDTYRDLAAAVDWVADRGVRTLDLWFVSLTDQNRSNVASMPRMTAVVPFMEEAFVRGEARGVAMRTLHVPRCLLPEAHIPRAYDPGLERVRVVTPDATFELRRSKLTGSRYVPACDGCSFRAICPGIREDYVERFGDAEFALARGQSPTLGERLPVV